MPQNVFSRRKKSTKRYLLSPSTLGWPYTRSPRQEDFQAVLDADLAGDQIYNAGDVLYVVTLDDEHIFSVKIAVDADIDDLVLEQMEVNIPPGKEFVILPSNRHTYAPGHQIQVGPTRYEMNNDLAWFPISATPAGSGSPLIRDTSPVFIFSGLAARDEFEHKHDRMNAWTIAEDLRQQYNASTTIWESADAQLWNEQRVFLYSSTDISDRQELVDFFDGKNISPLTWHYEEVLGTVTNV